MVPADAWPTCYASGWGTQFVDGLETWDTGGTWQNATYDDYDYRYRWTKTWQGQGEPDVNESATNHVTGLENGSASYWWRHTYPVEEGTQTDEGSSSGPWNNSYDTTLTYPGFSDGAYYGMGYGGGREAYFSYLGDAFSDYPGSDCGMFPFAYSDEELLLRQGQVGGSPGPAATVQQVSLDSNVDGPQNPAQPAQIAAREGGVATTQATGGDGSGGVLGAIGYYAGLYAYYFSQNLDYYQTGLDVAGTLPVLGEPCDAANAAISAARGDWTGAGLSAASMIPIYGDAVGKSGKAARYLAKYGDDAAAAVKGLDKAADTAKAISPRSLRALRPDPPAGMVKPQWHHDLPQAEEFQKHWRRVGLDIDDPKYGRWVEGGPVGNHQKWSYDFNKEWREFFRDNPHASREEILDFMYKLRQSGKYK